MRHITTGNMATRVGRIARVGVVVGVALSTLTSALLAESDVAAAPSGAARGATPAVRLDLPQIIDTTNPRINGQPLTRSWISHAEITAGGKLVLTMGPTPNKEFGAATADRPPKI